MDPKQAGPKFAASRDPGCTPVVALLVAFGLVAMALWFLLVAPTLGDDARNVKTLEATFPTLARIGAREFFSDEDCERIVTDRGVFTSGCRDRDFGDGEALPLDGQAQAEIQAILAASKAEGRRLRSADVSLGDGTVREGSFTFEGAACADYHFDPGYRALPDYDSETVVRIDEDWYLVNCF